MGLWLFRILRSRSPTGQPEVKNCAHSLHGKWPVVSDQWPVESKGLLATITSH